MMPSLGDFGSGVHTVQGHFASACPYHPSFYGALLCAHIHSAAQCVCVCRFCELFRTMKKDNKTLSFRSFLLCEWKNLPLHSGITLAFHFVFTYSCFVELVLNFSFLSLSFFLSFSIFLTLPIAIPHHRAQRNLDGERHPMAASVWSAVKDAAVIASIIIALGSSYYGLRAPWQSVASRLAEGSLKK